MRDLNRCLLNEFSTTIQIYVCRDDFRIPEELCIRQDLEEKWKAHTKELGLINIKLRPVRDNIVLSKIPLDGN